MTLLIPLLWTLACAGGSGLPTATIQVDGHPVKVEIASTQDSRQRGLMHRDKLAANSGMLFIYPDNKPRGFWMKDTRIPLSIAYADKQGKIVRIADMHPHSTERVPSLYPATYALEMDQGWFAAAGIEKGAMITGIPEVEVE